jgi:hypothetical protein
MARRKNTSDTPENTNQEDTMTTSPVATDTAIEAGPEDTAAIDDNDALEQDVDLDVEEPDEDVEETDGESEETESGESTDKAPKKPTKGDLPEGFVTPIQFAKILGERELHTDRDGNVVKDVKPQMVYSYMKNSPKDDRLEPQEIEDSNGVKRSVLVLEEALAWWARKNERAAQRKANAAEKAQKAANKAKTSDQALVETGEADPSILEATEEAE